MSKDLNLCQFIGRLGKDPETRMMPPNGTAVVNLTLAVGDDYKDKAGNRVEQTEWVRIVVFGKLGDIVTAYCVKGSRIYISGKMKTRSWEKDGVKQYSTEIVASEIQLLDSKAAEPNAGEPKAKEPKPAQAQQSKTLINDFDDDIPF